MYTSVYFHKTVRIAETMLSRAVERAKDDLGLVRFMTDAELLSWLLKRGELQRDSVLRLKYRRLYKRAVTRERNELSREEAERLEQLTDPGRRLRVEDTICRRAGIPAGKVIVDIPAPELLVTEPRISKVDLKVWEEGRVAPFRKVSSLAKALHIRETVDWALMVACDPRHTSGVQDAAPRVIFG